MSGRPTARQVAGWADELTADGERIGRHFTRSEPRRRAVGYVRGLLGDAQRKNGWQLAEHRGDPTPDGVQHLLARAGGDADAVRDDLLAYVAEHLGAAGWWWTRPGSSRGGAPSRAGWPASTAGRPAGSRTAGSGGVPRVRDHRAAGVPDAVGFATKVELARRMIYRAVDAGGRRRG